MRTNKLRAIGALLIAGATLQAPLPAQSVPAPAPAQSAPILLRGGTVHPGNGQPAVQADILIEGGKISAVGQPSAPAGATVIDAKGQHIYPGLVAPVTKLGIEEVEAVRATRDNAETGDINPNMRTLIAYNTDSRVTPTVRSNGILIAQVSPDGDLYAGTSSVVQLDAWNWEQAAYLADDAIHLYWPQMHISTHRFAPPIEEQKKRQKEALDQIRRALDDTRAYRTARDAGKLTQHDLRWEALIPVIDKKRPLWIHADTERQIRAAIAFMLEQDVRIVLVGASDAWTIADLIKLHQIPVVLAQPHSLPRLEDEDIDQPYKTARQLSEAGILVAISSEGFWQQRNLPFLAGTAAAYGLDPEKALQLVTLNPARILGIEARTGSLEPGKDANILISQGDLLDMRTSNVTWACIQGRVIDLGNHQKDLYEKFGKR